MKTLEGTNGSALGGAYVYKGPAESRYELGRSIVTMVQPAESLLRKDPTPSYGTNPAVRCPLLKSEMRAVLMMVTNILREQSLQMAFIQRNNVVQQVSSAAFDPTFRHTVLPGTRERGLHRAHLQGSNCRWKLPTIFRISIEDQKLGSGTKRKRLPQLLDDPTTRRTLGDVKVQDAPPIMADDEEIHGRNRFPMVSKEGQPALGRLRISRRSFHPTGDGSLGKFKTEHEEFPSFLRYSQGGVFAAIPNVSYPTLLCV